MMTKRRQRPRRPSSLKCGPALFYLFMRWKWAGEHFIFWDESFGPLRVNPLFTFNYTANYDGVYGWYYQVSFVDYFMNYLPIPAIPSHSCIILPPILQFDHFSASPLDSDDSRLYPMHMRLDGASKTLIRLIEGVLSISHLPHTVQKHGATTAKQLLSPLSHPRPPRCHQTSLLSLLMRWIAAWHSGLSEWRPFIDK